ncbi:MAG: hypothetical protein ABW133_01375, partial [Polyangiaceae bacterium]
GGTGGATGGSGGATGGTGGTTIDAGTGGTTGTGGAAGSGGATGGTGGATGGTGGATGGTGGATGGTGGATGGTGGATGGTGGTGAMDAAPEAPPAPGAVFAVGSFAKSGSTGSQTVTHGLGQIPKALILWTIGKTNETQSGGFSYGLGMSDASASYTVAASTRDGVSPSSAARRTASKALLMITTSGSSAAVLAEADLPGWSSTNFSLNWTTNDGQPAIVHYLVIGGPTVTSKLVNWQAPTSAGSKTVTGIGFQPEAVLHFHAGSGYDQTTPTMVANSFFGLGAMDRSGAQWAIQVTSSHNESPVSSSRAQRNDSALFMYSEGTSPTVTKDAKFVSMNADGFTLNFATANGTASQIYSLALGGLKAGVGTFNKTSGASQSVTSGFRPGAVFFSSYQSAAQTTSTSIATCSLGLGAGDGTNEASSALVSADNVSTTVVDGIDKTSKVFVKMNTPPLDAEADLASFDPSGFTLNWSTNDAVASQTCFLALGAP